MKKYIALALMLALGIELVQACPGYNVPAQGYAQANYDENYNNRSFGGLRSHTGSHRTDMGDFDDASLP
jgi:hypothetical protein